MNNKFCVSYETAQLLKEKGYNQETIHYYNNVGKLYLGNGHFNHNAYPFNLSAPTKAETIDWLESNGIVVELRYDYDELQKDDSEWVYYIYQYDNDGLLDETVSSWGMGEIYDTRLEAEEAAIIKALKLL